MYTKVLKDRLKKGRARFCVNEKCSVIIEQGSSILQFFLGRVATPHLQRVNQNPFELLGWENVLWDAYCLAQGHNMFAAELTHTEKRKWVNWPIKAKVCQLTDKIKWKWVILWYTFVLMSRLTHLRSSYWSRVQIFELCMSHTSIDRSLMISIYREPKQTSYRKVEVPISFLWASENDRCFIFHYPLYKVRKEISCAKQRRSMCIYQS